MKYDFICKVCEKKIEIDVPVSEYYIPECCSKKMNRIYYTPNISAGCLNKNNLPK